MRTLLAGLVGLALAVAAGPAAAADPTAIERGLDLIRPGVQMTGVGLAEAMTILEVAVGQRRRDRGRPPRLGARLWPGVSPGTLYQAASMSKLVTAVAALRLVQQGRLALDADVDGELGAWRLPASPLTAGHPVTLRWLLSMRGGVGPPGYLGYPVGAPIPDLRHILDGRPPARLRRR